MLSNEAFGHSVDKRMPVTTLGRKNTDKISHFFRRQAKVCLVAALLHELTDSVLKL